MHGARESPFARAVRHEVERDRAGEDRLTASKRGVFETLPVESPEMQALMLVLLAAAAQRVAEELGLAPEVDL